MSAATRTIRRNRDARERVRVAAALRYAIRGELRYLSHHDELRMLVRALRRADWPLSFSEGFNPQPRLRLPLPRSVAMASECQVARIELSAPRDARTLFESLAPQMPADGPLHEVICEVADPFPVPQAVSYTIDLTGCRSDALATRIAGLLAARQVVIQRDGGPKRGRRSLDVRPFVRSLELSGDALKMVLTLDGQRSARPVEIATALGLDGSTLHHRVCRTAIEWNREMAGRDRWPPSTKGTNLGREEKDHRAQETHRAQDREEEDHPQKSRPQARIGRHAG